LLDEILFVAFEALALPPRITPVMLHFSSFVPCTLLSSGFFVSAFWMRNVSTSAIALKIDLPTSIGNYNPDRGIVCYDDSGKLKLNLVRETRGTVVTIAAVLPYTAVGRLLRFTPLPVSLLGTIAFLAVTYLLLVQAV
jgi:hypothetical protein